MRLQTEGITSEEMPVPLGGVDHRVKYLVSGKLPAALGTTTTSETISLTVDARAIAR
jgi:hypothetical protein